MERLGAAEAAHALLAAEEKALESNDPKQLEEMCVLAKTALDAANRWTDNTFLLKDWTTEKLQDRERVKQFFQQCGVNFDSFDYLEQPTGAR